jgi:membrane protease YdiL (CAAX protease family)
MPDVSPILVALDVLVVAGSIAAIALVVRKLSRNEQLVPFEPRDATDAGGVFRWVRWAVIAARHKEGDPPDLTVSPPASHLWSDIGLGLIAFFASFLPIITVHVYLQQFVEYEHTSIESLRKNPSAVNFTRIAFVTIVLASVLEEFIFRNLLQGLMEVQERMLGSRLGAPEGWTYGVIPIVLSSAAFALGHIEQGAAAAPLFLFAMVLGYLYFQTHRLLPSIIAHAALNAFGMAQMWFLL